MAANGIKNIVVPSVMIVAGFAAIFALSGFVESQRPALPAGYEDTDLTLRGSKIKGFAFGMEGLLADWYYMRSLQYIGDKIVNSKDEVINLDDLRSLNPRLLSPMLENATDLDPHFVAAYSYGALVLPAIDPQKAIDLANKGIENNPTEWRLYQYLGYIYWKTGQYENAAEIYDRGAVLPGATPFMKLMAASMKNKGGSRETARAIYRDMLQNTPDEGVKITATNRLQELDSLDLEDAVDPILADFKSRNGRCVNTVAEIAPMLVSIKLPESKDIRLDKANNIVDPTGAPYLLNKVKCTLEPDRVRSRLPLR